MKTKDVTRFVIYGVLLVLVLAASGYAARHGYRSLRQARLVKQARLFIEKKEPKKALLSLQRALNADPKDVAACRLMAELCEAEHSPATLAWRTRAVELQPDSLEDRLALSRTAISLGDLTSATNALSGVSESGRKTAAYHNAAGSVSVALGQLPDAETHFLQASRLEPTNSLHRLNLAVVQLQQTNTQLRVVARASLQQLCKDPSVRCQALRNLIQDALSHRQLADALALSQDLLKQTDSLFSDRLLRLDVLNSAKDAGFQSALADFRRVAAEDPVKAYELANWQVNKTGVSDALSWMQSLPASTQTNQPLALLLADCRAQVKDWSGLQSTLQPQSWGHMEFVRHAYLALAMRGQNLLATSKTEWDIALKEAGGRKEGLTVLLRLASQWKWENEAEEILWSLVSHYPQEKWALQGLVRVLYAGGRTRSLMALFSQLSKANAEDLEDKNNLAVTALLLNAQEMKPHELALEAYRKSPTNASFASTYAFSLHVQNKNSDALKVMQKLSPGDLSKPSIAGYYALILQATGDKEKAKAYFACAAKAPLLPEEKKLFDKAKSGA